VSSIARTLLICCDSVCTVCCVLSASFAVEIHFSFGKLNYDQIGRFTRHGAVSQNLGFNVSKKQPIFVHLSAISTASSTHSIRDNFKQ